MAAETQTERERWIVCTGDLDTGLEFAAFPTREEAERAAAGRDLFLPVDKLVSPRDA